MQTQARRGLRVVRNLRTLFRIDRHIGFARRHDCHSPRCEERPQPHTERKRCSLFHLPAGEPSTRVVAPVRCIQNHYKSGRIRRALRTGDRG